MAHTPYPSQLDISCAKRVIEILISRSVVEDKQEFVFCLWNLLGYLANTSIGAPTLPHSVEGDSIFSSALPLMDISEADEGTVEELFSQCDAFLQGNITMAQDDPDSELDISTIMVLIPLIMQLIQAWRDRKNKKKNK